MSINRVNTGGESFKFLTNQSSILHTVDTNKITINGVNVIVDKPKRGDIMCITKDQKVIWIDGLSINPKQLSQEFEPVGICLVVKGNKALVHYRQEKSMRWAASERWEIPESSIMTDGNEHTLKITLNGVENTTPFRFTSTSRKEFVDQLNAWFLDHDKSYSAELLELDTDLPAFSKDENGIIILNPKNRIIINALFTSDAWKTIKIEEIGAGKRSIAKHINAVAWYYKKNGFKANYSGGCCQAKFYEYFATKGSNPSTEMTSIDSTYPVSLTAFTSNDNCQILRENFATYDEYLDSMKVKFPCGAGGAITEFPSGKDNTYKLAHCTFLDNTKDVPKQEFLYPAANWAASIDLNAPKLGKGNWWLPSPAEMTEIIRDITYGTSFEKTNPDIINSVLKKMTSIGWSMLHISSANHRWTSSRYSGNNAYFSNFSTGVLGAAFFYNYYTVSPITIYEF